MDERNSPIVKIRKQQLIMTRIFNSPRKLVYQIWTDPKHVAKWWGPRDFTTPVCEIDLRPDGAYRFVMRSPDGIEYPMKGIYLEIVEYEQITCTANLDEHPREWKDKLNKNLKYTAGTSALDLIIIVDFEDYDKKTMITITTQFDSDAIREAYTDIGMIGGWTESLERFEKELNSLV